MISYEQHDEFPLEAWRLYCKLTKRRDRNKVPDKVRDVIAISRANGLPNDEILDLIDAAARIPPYKGDSSDIRRLIAAFTKTSTYNKALTLQEDGGDYYLRPVVEAPKAESASKKQKRDIVDVDVLSADEMEQLSEWCQDVSDWSALDHAAGLILMRSTFDFDLERTVRTLSNEKGTTPYKALLSMIGSSSCVSSRSKYESDSEFEQKFDEIENELMYDPDARRLHLRGESKRTVYQFHTLGVPENYWSTVASYHEQSQNTTLLETYDQLEDQFHWHPMNRRTVA